MLDISLVLQRNVALFLQRRLISSSVSFLYCQFFLKEYELRKMARAESRRYCDPYALTYQAERMPEQIRMKVIIRCTDVPMVIFLLIKWLHASNSINFKMHCHKVEMDHTSHSNLSFCHDFSNMHLPVQSSTRAS